jgi:hypothetical protein
VARVRVLAEPFVICAYAEGFAESDHGPYDSASAPARLDCVLRPLPGVSGRVLADVRPVAGARVELHEAADPTTRIDVNGFASRVNPHAEASEETDVEGRFHLTLRTDGSFFLVASASGYADAWVGPLELRSEVGATDLEIGMGRGGAIEGKVLLLPGLDPAGIVVGANRGVGRPRTQRVGPDGRYRFGRLTPGRWLVDQREQELSSTVSTVGFISGDAVVPELPWNCEVFEGQTTHFDLDLTGDTRRIVSGELRLDGEPAGGWTASIHVASGAFSGDGPFSGATNREGRFVLLAPEGDRARLTLASDPGGPASIEITDVVALRAGETPWRLDLATGRLEGERATAEVGEGEILALWRGPGDLRARVRIPFEPDGRFAVPRVPAGTLRIVRRESGSPSEDPEGWPVVGETQVPPGGVGHVTIP